LAAYGGLALRETVRRAVDLYGNDPVSWEQVMINGMRQDWSWDRSAGEYIKLYQRLAALRGYAGRRTW